VLFSRDVNLNEEKMNEFYNRKDYETLTEERKIDYRTPFQKDRDRLIYTASFRRLQSKTQVFLSGEYDFYRTRLTHSLEVAQIGRSICHFLKQESPILNNDYFIDPDLVEVAGLSHDLGHPPFGHAGERKLHQLMCEFGGFEGNAQTLRNITDLIYSSGGCRRGFSPSRAYLDSILKYKTLFSEFAHPNNHFLYDSQKDILNFVFRDENILNKYPAGDTRNNFRSIECQIMDWADDTAYCINDLVDGIHARFITAESVRNWADENNLSGNIIDELFGMVDTDSFERHFGRKIGEFIQACDLRERENCLSEKTNRYKYELIINDEIYRKAAVYKKLARDIVFDSPQLQQLEHKSSFMIERLFTTFFEIYLERKHSVKNLLPADAEAIIRESDDLKVGARIICDHIAGMTDSYAIRIYKRLYDPDFGSIVDLV